MIPEATEEPLKQLGPLADACLRKRLGHVRVIMESGADPNRGTPLDKKTALHFAVAGGSLDIVRMLIEEFGAVSKPDRFGMLPIHE